MRTAITTIAAGESNDGYGKEETKCAKVVYLTSWPVRLMISHLVRQSARKLRHVAMGGIKECVLAGMKERTTTRCGLPHVSA
jgi:hypothetical protein